MFYDGNCMLDMQNIAWRWVEENKETRAQVLKIIIS